MLLFVVTAMVPGYMTGRLSYVDIAWPWGLAVIGALTLMMAPVLRYSREAPLGEVIAVALQEGTYSPQMER